MSHKRKSRRWALPLASVAVALALSRCDDLPAGPTKSGTITEAGEGPAPVACFTTDPNPPEVPARETIALDAGCSANVSSSASFEWDLGDERTASGRRVDTRYRRSGEYTVRLTVHDRGGRSQATALVTIRDRPEACFVSSQVLEMDGGEPCTMAFDATCSEGTVKEYRWFFEGGVHPDLTRTDTHVTTKEPHITHSWNGDIECIGFRPFERIVRLTVVDEGGATDTREETVQFRVPLVRR